ncbi:MAG: VWA domain-containing protein [Pseudohongiella sp.]|uniref:VWA domain-containing protein n=1 Tax=Pseudohongiella sp. TaxID=1979412 RepID=UPI0034A008D7
MKDIKKLFESGSKSDEKPASDAKAVASRPELDAFLQKVAAMPPVQTGNAAGRLVFALDATASREASWDQAMQLQAEMFSSAQSLGGLQVQLCYFRGFAEFHASDWYLETGQLLQQMTGIRCQAGITKIERLLDHVKAETRRSKVHAVVYIGDCMEESMDVLCQRAGELGLLNVPLFMFQEGSEATARRCFVEMARLSGGAYSPFDHNSADQLRDLLKAVAVYASGGLKALQDFSKKAHPAVKLLGHQLSR